MQVRGIKKNNSKIVSTLLAVLGFLIIIALWFLLSEILGEYRLPNPLICLTEMFSTVKESRMISYQGAGSGGFFPHIIVTTQRYLLGTAGGLALALLLLILCVRWRGILSFAMPVVDILKAIPPLALAPFLILWFGPTLIAVMSVTIFYTFITVFVAGVEALQRINPVYENFARTLGVQKNTIAFKVVFPALIPSIIGPIRVAVIASWGLVIVGEQLGISNGLGRIINSFSSMYLTSLIMVAIFWVLLIALIVEIIVSIVMGYITRWVPKVTNS